MSTSGRPRIEYTNKDYVSLRDAMLALAREKLPEWTDQSPNDLGVLLLELFAVMGDALFYYQDRIAAESYLETARERRSVMHMLRLIGYELRPPVPSSVNLTLYFKPTATGIVEILKGDEFRTTAEVTGEPVSFRYVRETIEIDCDSFPKETFQGKEYKVYRSVPVVQVDAEVAGEILASSDGSGRQRYALARKPLIDGTLDVAVKHGGSTTVWTQQTTLLHSLDTDTHYVVRRDENDVAWVEFGDGSYGMPPPRGRNNITSSYLAGGGAKGNVPVGAISKAIRRPTDLVLVRNEQPATGGADSEALSDATRRGPQQFRSMGRAVTAFDYELHARTFGVAKARATATGPSALDLFVAPAGGGNPTDMLKHDLRRYFETKRMITTAVEVKDPVYVGVVIAATVEVGAYFFQAQVEQQVKDVIRSLWAFENVNFEDTLYISKIYEAIEAIEGVAGVNITTFARTDVLTVQPGVLWTSAYGDPPDWLPPEGRLRFGFSEIPVCNGFTKLTVHGGRIYG